MKKEKTQRKVILLTTRFTLSLSHGLNSRSSDAKIKKSNPEKKVPHWSRGDKGIVGINSLGDGLEGEVVTWDTDEVGGDESHYSKHGCAAVTELALSEPSLEWLVSLREVQLVMWRTMQKKT